MKTKGKGIIPFLLPALIAAFVSCVGPLDSIDPIDLLNPSGNLIFLSIYSPPSKLVYEEGENLDLTGLQVLETYANSSSRVEYDYYNYEISGFNSSTPGVQTITIRKGSASGYFFITVNPRVSPDASLVYLYVSSKPNKTVYEAGQGLDLTGLQVTETYSDGSSRVEYNYSSYTIDGFNSASPGQQTITVSKGGRSATFTVTVNSPVSSDASLVSLSIYTQPAKWVYEIGESPNWTGLAVMETYSNGAYRIEPDSSGYAISGFNSASPGQQTIYVSKDGISAYFTVTVNSPVSPDASLVYLYVSSKPNKTVYEAGQGLDLTGLQVTETYSDGSSRVEYNHSGYAISGFNSASPGQQTITVSKGGKNATFTVTVNSPVSSASLVSLSIYTQPAKLIYEAGESYDWAGLAVTETYSDGSSRVEYNYSGYSISGFNPDMTGAPQTITVSKGNISGATFIVFINPQWTGATLGYLYIFSEPNKKTYDLYESPNWEGLIVAELYSDGSVRSEPNYSGYAISGFDSTSSGIKTITVSKSNVEVSFTVTVKGSTADTVLKSLSISPPYKTVYEIGESFERTGLTVTGTYTDAAGSIWSEPIAYGNYGISGFDSSSPGQKTINVSKDGISATFTVTVNPSSVDTVLVSLSIHTKPHKTVYEAGESFDWTGLIVTETYSNGDYRLESNYSVYAISVSEPDLNSGDAPGLLPSGERIVTVSKGNISATFTIIVNSPVEQAVLTSLYIYNSPKTVYELGESSNWTGLEVREDYSDGNFRIETSYFSYSINGFDSSTPGEKTITVSKESLSATFTVTVREVVLVSLSIYSWPNKTVYELNETSDWTGLTIREGYSDGGHRIEYDYSGYEISGFDSSSPGEKTISVSKGGISASFTVTVREAALVSLSVTTLPNKLVYEYGENADWTGMVVTGNYSDGSSREETSYDYIYFDSWSVSEQLITVSKNGISAPPFTVTVRQLYSLSVSTLPNKLIYEVGDSADWTGMVVTGNYSNGSEVITDYAISGFDSSSPGEKTIYVNKGGIYASFTVTVEGLMSLSINSDPYKKVYEMGESFDKEGLVVVGTYYVRGPIIESSYDIGGFDSSTPGVQTITVSKDGVSAPSFTIEALPRGGSSITINPLPSADEISLSVEGALVAASDGYAGYQWFVNDMARPADDGSDGKTITLTAAGHYRVRVTAWKQGLPYSGETVVTLQPLQEN